MKREWSYSRLDLFDSCRRAYWHRYVKEDAPSTDSEIKRDGQAVHDDIEAYAKHCYSKRLVCDLDRAEAIACRHDGTRDEVGDLFLDWAYRDAAAGGFNWKHVMADGKSVERWIERPLPNGDTFRGRLDLVLYDPDEKALICRDYKSGWSVPNYDPEKPPLQHSCYAWLAFSQWPVADTCVAQREHVRFPFEPIHEWEFHAPLERVEVGIMERIRVIEEWLAELETRDNRRHWHDDLRPSGKCGWCDYLLRCPVSRQHRFVLTTPDVVAKAWDVAEGLSAKASAIRGLLGDYVDQFGGLYFQDGSLLARHYPSHARPGGFVPKPKPGMLIKLLERGQRLGLRPEKLITASGLAKALEQHPEMMLDEYVDWVKGSASLGVREVVEPNIKEPESDSAVGKPKALEDAE